MINYGLLYEGRLLIVRFTGVIDMPYLKSFIDFIFPRTDPGALREILCDFRESEISLSPDEIKEIADIQFTYDKGLYQVKEVFLVRNPHNTVLASLFTISFRNWVLLVCSTLGYCINQFSLNMSDQELENIIEGLENKFQ